MKNLEGMTFVVTGVLDGFTRNEVATLIEGHGGKLRGSVSNSTNYLVVGKEPGVTKLEKAMELGVRTIGLKELMGMASLGLKGVEEFIGMKID